MLLRFRLDVQDADAVAQMVKQAQANFRLIRTVVHNALADYSFNSDARSTAQTMTAVEMISQQHRCPWRTECHPSNNANDG